MNYPLNSLFKVLKTSRQAFHNKANRYMRQQEEYAQLGMILDEFRKDLPGMSFYQIGASVHYLTFVMDLYSRCILGYNASISLHTERTTIPALENALRLRKASRIPGLIIHSDGGGQYYSKTFRALTEAARMLNSMGASVYENPHAERVNGVIKNNYVKHYNPTSYKELKRALDKAVRLYNEQKPHGSLGKLSPCQFENQLIIKDIDDENNSPSYDPLSTSLIHVNLKLNSKKKVNAI